MRILIESSNICNAKCIFCPHDKMKRKKGQMSDELFHKIIKEGKEIGAKRYYPFLNGDPFAFPKIYEWLDYMEKEKVPVFIYTNGDLMDAERVAKYSCIKWVNISLHAATKEIHKMITNGPDFDKAEQNARYLINNARFGVKVSMVEIKENTHQKEEFLKKWGRSGKVCTAVNWAGNINTSHQRAGKPAGCYHLLTSLAILWDGRVAFCCMDYEGEVIVGDVNKQTLREIWNAGRSVRNKHRQGDLDMPLCRNCNTPLI